MRLLGPSFTVPSNASRFYKDPKTAIDQSLGSVQLAIKDDQLIQNIFFNQSLIKYDECYCTTNSNLKGRYRSPTLSYLLPILSNFVKNGVVVDIGCGQGEFVSELRRLGVDAHGYDPVLRVESESLHKKLWSISDLLADLYVMRCVLPHIQDPFEFVSTIGQLPGRRLVLIEYQRLEWILEHSIWYQVSHDHVNLFTLNDFKSRYEVVRSGNFANGEWGWVLIDPKPLSQAVIISRTDFSVEIQRLFSQKVSFLEKVAKLDNQLIIWGAAGKGIVLSFALTSVSDDVIAIDMDQNRWGCFMEASGVLVNRPEEVLKSAKSDALILVCNPNHQIEVQDFIGGRFKVLLPSELVSD
jgi:hypothetical protein